MSEHRSLGIDYNDVPADFPCEHGTPNLERWADWGVCEELARFLGQEVHRGEITRAQSRAPRRHLAEIIYAGVGPRLGRARGTSLGVPASCSAARLAGARCCTAAINPVKSYHPLNRPSLSLGQRYCRSYCPALIRGAFCFLELAAPFSDFAQLLNC